MRIANAKPAAQSALGCILIFNPAITIGKKMLRWPAKRFWQSAPKIKLTKRKGAKMDEICKVYEIASKILTPKSYQWKFIAEKMYEIALMRRKVKKKGKKND